MNGPTIRQMAHLISEDIDAPEDSEFQECPECGTEFAVVNKDGIMCVNKDCTHYNDEYATAFKSFGKKIYGDVQTATKMAEARKKYKYEGKGGLVVMKTARERLAERRTHYSEEEKKRKLRGFHPERLVAHLDYLGGNIEKIIYKTEKYDYGQPSLAMAMVPTKTQLDTPGATIHFDDFIDQGYYYALFVRLPNPITLTSTIDRKYVGKYAKVKWRWPSPDKAPLRKGDFILTRTHQTFAVTKRNIAKMQVDGKWVNPMNWHEQLKWPDAL